MGRGNRKGVKWEGCVGKRGEMGKGDMKEGRKGGNEREELTTVRVDELDAQD